MHIGFQEINGKNYSVYDLASASEQWLRYRDDEPGVSPCTMCSLKGTPDCSFKLCAGASRPDHKSVRFELVGYQPAAPQVKKNAPVKQKQKSPYTKQLDAIAELIGPAAYGPNGGVRYSALPGLLSEYTKQPQSHEDIMYHIASMLLGDGNLPRPYIPNLQNALKTRMYEYRRNFVV